MAPDTSVSVIASDVPLPPGPMPLVDVAADRGWTLAVAATLPRETRPAPVLPLVLSSRP